MKLDLSVFWCHSSCQVWEGGSGLENGGDVNDRADIVREAVIHRPTNHRRLRTPETTAPIWLCTEGQGKMNERRAYSPSWLDSFSFRCNRPHQQLSCPQVFYFILFSTPFSIPSFRRPRACSTIHLTSPTLICSCNTFTYSSKFNRPG